MNLLHSELTTLDLISNYNNNTSYLLIRKEIPSNKTILLLNNKYLVYKFIYCLRIKLKNIRDRKVYSADIVNRYIIGKYEKDVLTIADCKLSYFYKNIFYGHFKNHIEVSKIINNLDNILKKILNNELIV